MPPNTHTPHTGAGTSVWCVCVRWHHSAHTHILVWYGMVWYGMVWCTRV